MQASQCSMRPGAYRSFTFRLPQHLPTAHVAVAVRTGCVSIFVSNCSRKPQARSCQWQRFSVRQFAHMSITTHEKHYHTGLYHVGVYCEEAAELSVGCFPQKAQALASASHAEGPKTAWAKQRKWAEDATAAPVACLTLR